jgi:hypothetical protein
MTDPTPLVISPGDPQCWPTPSAGVANTVPTYDPPTLTSLAPATGVHGGATLTMHANGSGFVPGAVILWNGVPVATTFVSATDLSTPVVLTNYAAAASISVSVRNHPTNVASAALTFAIT